MEFQEVLVLLEEIETDRTVPRNVRSAVLDVKKNLKNENILFSNSFDIYN